MTVLLDTHALLWWQADGRRLSRAASRAIDGATSILISPVSCWEVTQLHRMGRIVIDREPAAWVRDLLRADRMAIAELTPEAATWAGVLDTAFPGDPIDRLVYATARDQRIPLVSKDEGVRRFAEAARDVEIIW